jgi:hypothetical protein
MEAAGFTETPVLYRSTPHHVLEDLNLKSRNIQISECALTKSNAGRRSAPTMAPANGIVNTLFAAHVDGPATYVRRLDRQLPLFMIE